MPSNLKILIIDDDEDDYFITSQYLEESDEFNINCNWCYNSKAAEEELISNKYDVYFIDYRLGAKTGLEILTHALQNGCVKPVILLTGNGNLIVDKLAVKIGAYDYLVKSDLTTEKLERCLRYALERYRNFKIINENEKKYRLIFENALSFIFICDTKGNFIDCNIASESITEFTPAELKTKSLFDCMATNQINEMKILLSDNKNVTDFPLQIITKNNAPKSCNLSIRYFEDDNGLFFWQGIIYDETIRNREQQIILQNEKMEATYRLVGTLAHEIRNPLTNIGLSLECIAEDKIEEQKRYIDIIKRSSVRINNLITELLQSSKKVELRKELYDLNLLVKEAIEFAEDRIKLKKVVLNLKLLPHSAVKLIDIEKLKIAVLNLIVNGVEACEQENGVLDVSVTQTLDETQITIKDNGCGMSEENLKKLFEPYFTTKKNGMGLGLVSTLNIIKSHSASIVVESAVGVGTTFKIIFP